MTVSSNTIKKTYLTDGVTTEFPFTWIVYDSDEISVYKVDGSTYTQYDLNYDYTVSGTENPSGGSVIFEEAPPDGSKLLIISDIDYVQEIDFANNSILSATTIEEMGDKASLRSAQLYDMYSRAVKVPPIEDTIGYLPVVSERASRLFAYDVSGNPTYTNYTADEIASIFPTLSGSTMTTAYFSILGTVSGSSSLHLRPDNENTAKAWDITANAAGNLEFINYATGSGVSAFTLGATTSGSTNFAMLVNGVLSLQSEMTTLSGAYNSISNTVSSITDDLAFSNYWSTTLSGIYSDIFLKGIDTLDDVTDGATYGKVLKTSVSAGQILLSAVVGNMDNIVNGSTYGKVLLTALSAGQILLSSCLGDLDDIANGGTYSKTLSTIVDAGYIYMMRKAASSTTSFAITSTGFESYVNNVKRLECISGGSLSMYDTSAVERINISTTGVRVGNYASGNKNILIGSADIKFRNYTTEVMTIDQYGPHSTVAPCFHYTLSANATNVTGDNTTATIPFNKKVVDQGNNFNTSTYTFTAPCKGNYLLIAQAWIIGLTSSIISGYISIVTTQYSYGFAGLPVRAVPSSISDFPRLSVIAPMNAGDTAYVTVRYFGGSKVADVCYNQITYFSGCLLN